MKKSFGIITISILVVGMLLYSCTSSSDKVENAKENVTDAKQDLENAKQAYKEDMKDYKERTAIQIAANEKSIQDFNARIANQKNDAKADYELKIAELNSKNSDLKKKMDDFKTDSESAWEKFKSEFGNDMEQLGTAIKDFTIKNEK